VQPAPDHASQRLRERPGLAPLGPGGLRWMSCHRPATAGSASSYLALRPRDLAGCADVLPPTCDRRLRGPEPHRAASVMPRRQYLALRPGAWRAALDVLPPPCDRGLRGPEPHRAASVMPRRQLFPIWPCVPRTWRAARDVLPPTCDHGLRGPDRRQLFHIWPCAPGPGGLRGMSCHRPATQAPRAEPHRAASVMPRRQLVSYAPRTSARRLDVCQGEFPWSVGGRRLIRGFTSRAEPRRVAPRAVARAADMCNDKPRATRRERGACNGRASWTYTVAGARAGVGRGEPCDTFPRGQPS
jgi:hypothetical protein